MVTLVEEVDLIARYPTVLRVTLDTAVVPEGCNVGWVDRKNRFEEVN